MWRCTDPQVHLAPLVKEAFESWTASPRQNSTSFPRGRRGSTTPPRSNPSKNPNGRLTALSDSRQTRGPTGLGNPAGPGMPHSKSRRSGEIRCQWRGLHHGRRCSLWRSAQCDSGVRGDGGPVTGHLTGLRARAYLWPMERAETRRGQRVITELPHKSTPS